MAKVKVSKLAEDFGMDVKVVLERLNKAGLKASRRNSSVDEAKARALFDGSPKPANAYGSNVAESIKDARSKKAEQGAKVVSLEDARTKKPAQKSGQSAADRKLAEFYKKYPHVVTGSVREPTSEDKKVLGAKCHGKVCTIKCVDTGELRTINTQDAFQVKRTAEAQEKFLRRRRAERRAEKKAKKAKAQNG